MTKEEVMSRNIYLMIRKFGKCRIQARGKDPGLYTTVCQGCGKLIRSDDDLVHIDLSQTKRGDCYFWHTECSGKVCDNKIQWKEPENEQTAEKGSRKAGKG